MNRHPAERVVAEERALLFLHIPKTGGTTLRSVIERDFAPGITYSISGIMPSQSIKEFTDLAPEQREKIRLVMGHMPYGLHRYLSAPATYITILRDPVDRIISHYYFVRRSPGIDHHKEVTSRGMSLEDFIRERASIKATNDQTRLISGVEKVNARLLSEGSLPNEEAGATDILEIARKNLEDHFMLVGLCERFDESLLLFRKLLGWKNIYYVKQNVTKGRPTKQQVAREAISLIEKHNELDMTLYEYAWQRFEETVKEQEAGFTSELRSFQRNNMLYAAAWRSYLLTRTTIPKVKATVSRRARVKDQG